VCFEGRPPGAGFSDNFPVSACARRGKEAISEKREELGRLSATDDGGLQTNLTKRCPPGLQGDEPELRAEIHQLILRGGEGQRGQEQEQDAEQETMHSDILREFRTVWSTLRV
jgi:hypothetical protein